MSWATIGALPDDEVGAVATGDHVQVTVGAPRRRRSPIPSTAGERTADVVAAALAATRIHTLTVEGSEMTNISTVIVDDEPRDVHLLSCAVWNSNDDRDCGSFEAGVQAKLDQFESCASGGSR